MATDVSPSCGAAPAALRFNPRMLFLSRSPAPIHAALRGEQIGRAHV